MHSSCVLDYMYFAYEKAVDIDIYCLKKMILYNYHCLSVLCDLKGPLKIISICDLNYIKSMK